MLSGSASATDPNPGIVGSDDRTITSDGRFTAVGRLNLSGKGFCGAGWWKGKPLAHRLGKHIRRHPKYAATKSLAADIALIVLERPIAHPKITPIPIDRAQGNVRLSVPLTHVSYSKDRPHLPSIESGCVVRAEDGRVLYTDCDSNFGGSGAPILRETEGGFRVLGIISGVVERNGLRRVAAVRAHSEE